MNKKDFIRDDGKIRNCRSNTAKMNVLEYIIFDVTTNKFFKWAILDIIGAGAEGFKNLAYCLINLIALILFPVTLVIRATSGIKYSRKEVEKHKKMYGNK